MRERACILAMVVTVAALVAGLGAPADALARGGPMIEFGGDLNLEGEFTILPAPNAPAPVPAVPEESRAPAPPADLDVVAVSGGGRLVGTVVAMESGGKLRLTGPQFQGEVAVAAGAVTGLFLRGNVEPSGNSEIVLTGGDRVLGMLSAITADEIVVDTTAGGRLKIPRRAVRIVNLAAPSSRLPESAFMFGKLDPWTADADDKKLWSFDSGVLVSHAEGGAAAKLTARLDYKEALTVEARIEPVVGPLTAELTLFEAEGGAAGTQPTGNYVRGAIRQMPNYVQLNLQSMRRSTGTSRSINRQQGAAIALYLTYDPAGGQVRFWTDGVAPAEFAVLPALAGVKSVQLKVTGPARVEFVRVLSGIVQPGGAAVETAEAGPPDGVLVEFANKDRLQARQIALTDGQLTLSTEHGDVRCDVASVSRMVCGKKGDDPPALRPDDVQVFGAFGRLTVRFDRLSADELVGRSDVLGEVRLRRAAVREIKFAAPAKQ
jgi:hypothetical protein